MKFWWPPVASMLVVCGLLLVCPTWQIAVAAWVTVEVAQFLSSFAAARIVRALDQEPASAYAPEEYELIAAHHALQSTTRPELRLEFDHITKKYGFNSALGKPGSSYRRARYAYAQLQGLRELDMLDCLIESDRHQAIEVLRFLESGTETEVRNQFGRRYLILFGNSSLRAMVRSIRDYRRFRICLLSDHKADDFTSQQAADFVELPIYHACRRMFRLMPRYWIDDPENGRWPRELVERQNSLRAQLKKVRPAHEVSR